jgi:hypothetical protein
MTAPTPIPVTLAGAEDVLAGVGAWTVLGLVFLIFLGGYLWNRFKGR